MSSPSSSAEGRQNYFGVVAHRRSHPIKARFYHCTFCPLTTILGDDWVNLGNPNAYTGELCCFLRWLLAGEFMFFLFVFSIAVFTCSVLVAGSSPSALMTDGSSSNGRPLVHHHNDRLLVFCAPVVPLSPIRPYINVGP